MKTSINLDKLLDSLNKKSENLDSELAIKEDELYALENGEPSAEDYEEEYEDYLNECPDWDAIEPARALYTMDYIYYKEEFFKYAKNSGYDAEEIDLERDEEFREMFDEYLNNETTFIESLLSFADALKELDLVAYREGLNNYTNSRYQDELETRIEEIQERIEEIQERIEEIENEIESVKDARFEVIKSYK